jgi:hypothetical protein
MNALKELFHIGTVHSAMAAGRTRCRLPEAYGGIPADTGLRSTATR